MSKWFLVAATAALVGVWPGVRPATTAGGGSYAWQFEVLETLPTVPNCSASVDADMVKIDRDDRLVVGWRESGCGAAPGSGLRWGHRDPRTLAWTLNTVIDQACGFLACVGLRGNPPALALRPDGSPFYLFGREGDFEHIYIAIANLQGNPSGSDPALVEDLAQYQSDIAYPAIAADFPANADENAAPNYIRAGTAIGGSPLTLNGTPLVPSTAHAVFQSLDYASGPIDDAHPRGRHHVVFYGSVGEGFRYYYSDGTPGSVRSILDESSTAGLHVAVDANNRIHLALAGMPGDINTFWSSLAYLTSEDGTHWTQTILDPGAIGGHPNARPAIALDSLGNPGIAYFRHPDQIRLARFDGSSWQDTLITTTGSPINAITAPHLAFDRNNRPIVFFFHPGTNSLMTATGEPGVSQSALAVSIAGGGSVASVPAGIACPSSCIAPFAPNAFVTLVATPANGSAFAGWTGACTGTGPCVLQMNGATSVGATFIPAPARHHIEVSPICSLADAIRAANTDLEVNGCPAGSGPDTIDVPAGTYTLTTPADVGHQGPNGLPSIYTDILIQGASAASTVIERAPGSLDFRILYVDYSPAGGTLTLNRLTIRGGSTLGAGLLMASGPVFINDSVFENHNAAADYGGAIRVWGLDKLEINRTTFKNNHAQYGGGAIETAGPLSIVGSLFDGNSSHGNGGTLELSQNTTLIDTHIIHSSAVYTGGAIYNAGTLLVTGSYLNDNVLNSVSGGTGGAVANTGALTIIGSTLMRNHANDGSGGAIGNHGSMSVVGTTVANNDATRWGGGIYSNGVSTLTNTTLSGNAAGTGGGGLYNGATLTLNNVTIAANSTRPGWASGVYAGTSFVLRNTIIAGNTATPGEIDCWSDVGSSASHGYNLIGVDTNCLPLSLLMEGDQVGRSGAPIDPMLGPLADNGGSTFTHAVPFNSPAHNAGNPDGPDISADACATSDQRGVVRPQRGRCDIGAFEKANNPPVGSSQTLTTDEDTSLDVMVAATDADGDAVTYEVLDPPVHGVLNGTAPSFTYTPASNFNGTDAFTFAGRDEFATTGAPATVTVNVTPVNDPPTAVDDHITIANDGLVHSLDVLANDNDLPDTGEELEIASVFNPNHGTATITVDRSQILYAPVPGYAGDDSFVYVINDGNGGNATASVTIEVEPSPVVNISVIERIRLDDSAGILPAARIQIDERLTVGDNLIVLPSAMLHVSEQIHVDEVWKPLPAALISIDEVLRVSDETDIGNTIPGADVVVKPVDPQTGTTPVSLTFTTVTQAGITSVVRSTVGPAAPAGFALGTPSAYFDISTSAGFSGPILVCLNYSGITFMTRSPKVFHLESSVWMDRTVSLDAAHSVICARVTSLSPFAVFEPGASEGRMIGEGALTRPGGGSEHFNFRIAQRLNGDERGHLHYSVRTPKSGKQKEGTQEFESTSIGSIAFWDDPGFTPGNRPKPAVDSAVFVGDGRWNNLSGYTFEARVSDEGEPGRARDTFEITIRDIHNVVIATTSGKLQDGNIQSLRVPKRK